ncbi:helix-turn-helix domain-containing protein [Desulforamulus reducens]|nr:helix-turn-helix transcriptional regulator [Desulforamulus reducens]
MAIALHRKKLDITAANAAKKLGISRGFLSILELGLRLPPNNIEFIKAVADLVHVSESEVLSSVLCEHFFASTKNLSWFPVLISKAIAQGFRRYYLFDDYNNVNEDDDFNSIRHCILKPADQFRSSMISHIIEKFLIPVGGDFIKDEYFIDIDGKKMQVLGYFTNVKPHLYKSDNLFPLRESIVFMDSFGIHERGFRFSFHTPFTKPAGGKSFREVSVSISPFDKNPIHFLELPLMTSTTKFKD